MQSRRTRVCPIRIAPCSSTRTCGGAAFAGVARGGSGISGIANTPSCAEGIIHFRVGSFPKEVEIVKLSLEILPDAVREGVENFPNASPPRRTPVPQPDEPQ